MHLIDDVDVGSLPGHRDGQNVMRTHVTSNSGYANFIFNFKLFWLYTCLYLCLIIMYNTNHFLLEKSEEIVLIEILKVPERYVFMTKRKVYFSMINIILETIKRHAWKIGFDFELFPYCILGALIKLSNNCRTAERRRPYDEFNHGVAITHRPLKVILNPIAIYIFIKRRCQ